MTLRQFWKRFPGAVLTVTLLFALAGCVLDDPRECGCTETVSATPAGARLWAANCRRCHNLRTPTSYTSEQWDVAINHMRLKAGITADDARQIADFLKAFR